jgi:hypothetical protein
VAVAATILVAACQVSRYTDPRIVLLDSTESYIEVSNARIQDEGGTPLFVADIANTSSYNRHRIEWCVEFRNGVGQQVARADTRWASMGLESGESRQVQMAASDPNATDFLLKVRKN